MDVKELEFKLKNQKMLMDMMNSHINDLSKRVFNLEKQLSKIAKYIIEKEIEK